MGEVLVKSGTLVFLIVLGYVLKCVGLFKTEDSKLLSKIMIYVTLPGILLGAAAGCIFGFCSVPLMLHTRMLHQGFNLYGMGIPLGIMADVFIKA